MKRNTRLATIVWLSLGVAALASGGAVALERQAWPYCSRTAELAHRACRFDVADDYNLARAACLNESDREDRETCHAEAAAALEQGSTDCQAQREARLDVCADLGEGRYDPAFDEEAFVHPDAIGVPNPYQTLDPGHTTVLRAEGELIVIHVTDRVRLVDDVPCRVVIDAAFEVTAGEEGVEYSALEVTDDWYAQHANGDIWYCGELSRDFDDGELSSLDGSFEAGVDGAKPGILVPFDPRVGDLYRQEFALGEAEDLAEVLSLAATPGDEVAGFACDGECLLTRDFAPLSPGAEEHKYYRPGTGFVLAIALEDGEPTGEREERVCDGASIGVLSEPACGIENPAGLLAALCRFAPDTCTPR